MSPEPLFSMLVTEPEGTWGAGGRWMGTGVPGSRFGLSEPLAVCGDRTAGHPERVCVPKKVLEHRWVFWDPPNWGLLPREDQEEVESPPWGW